MIADHHRKQRGANKPPLTRSTRQHIDSHWMMMMYIRIEGTSSLVQLQAEQKVHVPTLERLNTNMAMYLTFAPEYIEPISTYHTSVAPESMLPRSHHTPHLRWDALAVVRVPVLARITSNAVHAATVPNATTSLVTCDCRTSTCSSLCSTGGCGTCRGGKRTVRCSEAAGWGAVYIATAVVGR